MVITRGIARRLRRVLVLCGDPTRPDPTKWGGGYSAHDRWLHFRMREALAGFDGYAFEFSDDHDHLIDRLTHGDRPDWVLNFCDTGFRNVAACELHVPALLEMLELPYSGAPPASMVLCYDKAVVRLVAEAHGVPTPVELYVPAAAATDALSCVEYPAIVKPARGDGSTGINRDSIVRSADEAARQLAWLHRELPGRAALVQEYLPGAEYSLTLIGNPEGGFDMLVPLEVDYRALPESLPPILAFDSKTGPANPYSVVGLRPARLDVASLMELRRHAQNLFARLACRDYARFDFRTGADGRIKLLEVNPNPAWDIESKLAVMGSFAGWNYAETLRRVIAAVESRLLSPVDG